MPIITDGPALEPTNKGIDEYHVNWTESLGATASEAIADFPTVQLKNLLTMPDQEVGPLGGAADALGSALPSNGPSIAEATRPAMPRIDIMDANDRVKKAGLAPHLKLPDQPDIPPAQLDIMMSRAQARREYEVTQERGPQGFVQTSLSVGTSFLVGAVDPLNIASAFVPIMGELRYAKLLAGAGEGFAGRAGVRAAVGAGEGAFGQALLEPLDWWSHTQDGRDFGMSDVLHNIMFGAVLGGALHTGGGAISDAWRARKERPMYPYDLGEPFEFHTPFDELRRQPAPAAPGLGEFPGIRDTPIFNEAPDQHVTAASLALEAEAARPTVPSAAVQTINDLPPRAREDAARAGIASLIDGEPLRVGEMIEAAAQTDPRIAESFEAHIRNERLSAPAAREAVFDDVHRKLIDAGMGEDEAGYNAAVVAARYAARAERLGLGQNAVDLYRAEGLDVRAGEHGPAQGRSFQQSRGEGADLFAAREADGQLGLPGTERIGQGELAQRKADEALKPKVAQKPLDVGLFGDSAAQKSFFQSRPLTPAFYSAVDRAIGAAKQDKASPDQWLGMLKNAGGVKPEEMKWLGLEDWLGEQKGSVSKEQVQAFVRANQIEVKEVAKGGLDIEKRARELAEAENGAGSWDRIGGGGQEHYYRDARRENGTKYPSYVLPGGENYRELLLTLPEKSQFDPSQVRIERVQLSTTQANVRLFYGDHKIGMYEDNPLLDAATGRYIAKPDQYWVDVMRRRYGGDPSLRIAPLDGGENFRSGHWEEPNVLAHIRFDDRISDGKRTLHVAEVQSDWHQAGRKRGYTSEDTPERQTLMAERDRLAGEVADLPRGARETGEGEAIYLQKMERITEINEKLGQPYGNNRVPDAPFKTTWPEMSMKRMIRYAAEHGYERISWDTGATNAERYDLSKQIKEVRYSATKTLQAKDHAGNMVLREDNVEPERLSDLIGKDAAERLLAQEPSLAVKLLEPVHREYLTVAQTEHQYVVTNVDGREVKVGKGTVGSEAEAKEYTERLMNSDAKEINARRVEQGGSHRTLSGLDLKVGGEGMAGFYDKVLPATVSKLVKKFGAKVAEGEIGSSREVQLPHFEGRPPTKEQLAQVAEAVEARPTDQRFISPVTGERQMFQINRAANQQALREVRQQMNSGVTFAEAMERHGNHDLAQIFGGNLETRLREENERHAVHAVDITPELRKAAVEQGFPLFQGGEDSPRGRITLSDNRAVIDLFKSADRSTFMHESGHLWLEELMRDASHQDAPAPLRADRDTVLAWLGVKDASEIGTAQHEKWAEGFEHYLSTGEAPSNALAKAFEQFKVWLAEIYRAIAGLHQDITPEIRGVMDRMLASDAEIAERRAGRQPLGDATAAARPAAALAKPKRGRAAADPATWSLFEYLASRGGLKPDADLLSIFGSNKSQFVPGFGPLLRKTGMTMDDALVAAKEGGYFLDPTSQEHVQMRHADLAALNQAPTFTLRDLHEKIDEESRGRKQYRDGHVQATRADAGEEAHYIIRALYDELEASSGQKGIALDPAIERRVVEIIQREGEHDVLAAHERAIMEDEERYNAVSEARHADPKDSTLPGWDVPNDAGTASARGGEAARAGGEAGRAGPGAGGDAGIEPRIPGPGDRAPTKTKLDQDAAWRRLAHATPEFNDPNVIAASNAAAEVKRPPTKLDERLTAAEKAESYAKQMYDMFAERIPPEDRQRLDDLIKTIESDHEAREIAIERGGACLYGARE